MTMINTPPARLFHPDKVDAVAAEMNANDEDWTYVVKHDPTGRGMSLIEIFDEDGEPVGKV